MLPESPEKRTQSVSNSIDQLPDASLDKARHAEKRVAVITGASSGIGETFARRLAARGHDLLLTSRRQDRLVQLSSELQKDADIAAEVVTADLSKRDDMEKLAHRIAELEDLELLINNAGFGTLGNFEQVELERHLDMVRVHIDATVMLTYAALPKMIQQNKGYIINVSSVAAFLVGPGQITYNATKAFVKSFSESLQSELATTDVRVQALCPGITRTGFHDTPDFEKFDRSQFPKSLWMTAEDVVTASLRSLNSRQVVCVPGIKNRVIAAVLGFGPVRRLAGRVVQKKPE